MTTAEQTPPYGIETADENAFPATPIFDELVGEIARRRAEERGSTEVEQDH
ncbi:hypothetical protein SAMN05443637_102252 [Pseudonocardia thermophila]|jgi:hypothetical protein|uniref:Uncharacterized protein n=1 Tax=Pseudonocardia thermophila TaxID=1848 RepID=A0A1M6PG95_PSETH|nr:hypothetical protein [Pseudonocardia thermophila]SHK06944.1 hypothetical protein SAMN05443637_102252 [Pseudonocardia thermophila]